ncbi:MAG: nicotinate-nucleotide adenylyltransferase [Proteobacteria bacterium]|nr:nicotinate-nucleotide adenylyltransferase [Pseudomonadota bacterium]
MKLRTWYGGTYDPVHDGHLAIARAARDALDGPIRFMPAADPPHRPPPGANATQRAEMLALAVAGEPGLRLDLRELRRDGPSYSVDTLRELRAEYGPQAPLALLVGADSLLGLPAWHDWTALFGLAHFVVADRPGSVLDTRLPPVLAEATAGRWLDDPRGLREAPAGRLLRLNQPLHPGSATEVRHRIATGGAWRDLLPPPVADYIVRHRLYGVDRTVHAPSL